MNYADIARRSKAFQDYQDAVSHNPRNGSQDATNPFIELCRIAGNLERILQLGISRATARHFTLLVILQLDVVSATKIIRNGSIVPDHELPTALLLVKETSHRLERAHAQACLTDLTSSYIAATPAGSDPNDVSPSVRRAYRKAKRLALAIEIRILRHPLANVVAQAAPAVMATRIAHGVVNILPVDSRSRYREEFESDLQELAVQGASRWAQIAYSFRLVDQAWILRAELQRAAARRKAARP